MSLPPNSTAEQPLRNPFLPYDPELYVCDVEPRHVCLLNKYQVVASHLLIVTRDFQRQEGGLDAGDFEALWRCLAEREGIGFYNGGQIAGASQPHRHLQLIPFLDPRQTGFPLLESWDSSTEVDAGIWRARLPFPHALQRLELSVGHPAEAGALLQDAYRQLLRSIGRGDPATSDPLPYNLLITRRWMFAVPRSQEMAEGISLNALAFAGALLVRDDAQLQRVRQRGPLKMLVQVSDPKSAVNGG
jgi:sulfate adenylyltransferase (ADP) / ATP adenylyltransferase